MISFFRRALSSWIVLGLLGLIMIAFIITGVGTPTGLGGMGGGEAVAKVEGEPVTASAVTDRLNRELTRARQQDPEMDIASMVRAGLLDQIVSRMISDKALILFGIDQGMGASKRTIDGQIASIPAFRNLAGEFDQTAFQNALRSENLTEQQLRDDLSGSIIQRYLLLPVAGSAKVPQSMALHYASLLLESRTGNVGLIPAQAAGIAAPSDAEVNAFYRTQAGRYTIPERRVLRYAVFGAEQVAQAATPTEAEIQAAYKANAAYRARETRTLSQVVLPDQAAARAFAAKLAAGTPFAAAAAQAGFGATDIAVGAKTKAEFTALTSAAVANAAFAAASGATIAPTESDFGWHVVKVDAVSRTAERPLASVRGEIAAALAKTKQQDALSTLVGRVEDALGEGSSFEEVARAEKLNIQQTAPITATGTQPGNPQYRVPAELAPLLRAGFEMGADEDPVVETLSPERFAILAVGNVTAAAPPPLGQILARVKADLVAQRASDRAKAIATGIADKINRGMPAAQAFQQSGIALPPVQRVTARRIDIARANQAVPPPLAMLFSLPKGKARIIQAPNGQGWTVVHLESNVVGDASKAPELIQATRSQFEAILGEEYADQFAGAVQKASTIKRDDGAIKALKASLLGPGAQ